MKKGKRSDTNALIILISSILVLLNICIGIFFIFKSRTIIKEFVFQRMIGISDTAAYLVDGDKVKAITEEDRINNTEIYQDVYDSISAFKEKNDFEYIYIVRDAHELDSDGHEKFVFIVDADEETPSEYGEEIVYTEALYNAAHGKHGMDNDASADKWGSFYSAFSPIYDSSNNIVGVVGVDFLSQEYENQVSKFSIYLLINNILSLLIGGAIAFLISSRIIRKFRTLNKELIILANDVNTLAEEVSIKPLHSDNEMSLMTDQDGDEIEQLSHKIKSMQQEIRNYLEYIHTQASLDIMTGVGNKGAYLDYVKSLDEKISKNTADFTIIVFDINGLKEVNDNKGHEEGDNYIINTTKVITAIFGVDHTYRIGGDEFIVILENISQEEVESMFIKVRSESERFNKTTPDLITTVSFSMGAATYRKDMDNDYKAVFKRADDAMYRNKSLYYKDFNDRRKK